MFSLSFIENHDHGRFSFDTDTEILGRIRLNDFEEYFSANITFWSADEYRAQWREGLSRICDGVEKSCVLTSVSRPETAHHFGSWGVYRLGSETIFQNRLLMLDQLGEPFLFSRVYDFVLPYRAISENGDPISQWKIPVVAIEKFLAGRAEIA